MKAIAYRVYGGPEALELLEMPDPKVSQNSVLVRVKAASINPADLVLQAGLGDAHMDAWFPVVPGWDVAGVVEAVGAGVSELRAGDEVLGYLREEILHHGTYAEKVAAPMEYFVRKPAGMTWAEAAGLPLAALTAYRAIVGVLAISKGETILIHGAAGGVGAVAAQLASSIGARVVGHDSAKNHDYLRTIGVEPVASEPSLTEAVRAIVPGGVDAVLDCAGKGLLATTRAIGTAHVRACGIVEPSPDSSMAFARRDPVALAAMVDLVQAGKLSIRVGRTFPLAQAADAQRALREGSANGKVVLMME